AYVPATVQECFDFTIKAFNASEKYRTPVMLMPDQILGLMTANITIPDKDDIVLVDRVLASGPVDEYEPYDWDHVIPPMAIAGQGYGVHMTGLTHDEHGYPDANVDAQAKLLARLQRKFDDNIEDIVEYEEVMLDDADIAIVAYGTESRSALAAIKLARAEGIKVGMLRMITVWPFHEKLINDLSKKVEHIIVPEVNMGQYVHPVREYSDCPVTSLPHYGGQIHRPDVILDKIKEVMK
ncbi:MAG: transketolase C-terminal domain-containing protein, partial [Candidatus Kariarchaeaceae archaeon]